MKSIRELENIMAGQSEGLDGVADRDIFAYGATMAVSPRINRDIPINKNYSRIFPIIPLLSCQTGN